MFLLGPMRSAPIIQQIDNQTAVVGSQFKVKCEAVAQAEPHFNLVQVLSNGSVVPVKIGGNIRMGPVIRRACIILMINTVVTTTM